MCIQKTYYELVSIAIDLSSGKLTADQLVHLITHTYTRMFACVCVNRCVLGRVSSIL